MLSMQFCAPLPICPKAIYIGETNNLVRQQMNGHTSDIRLYRNKPVAEHLNKADHTFENLKLAVIKKVKGTQNNNRTRRIKIYFQIRLRQ